MRVLLVEDETIVRRFMKSLIDWEAHGYEVVAEASNGEEAWAVLASEPIDIVLTDIRMPVMGGFELIERMAREGLACEVVILSSYDDYQHVRTALKLNVSDYVHKATISEAELLDCLNKAKADWLKRQEQTLATSGRAVGGHWQALSREGVVAANLLVKALEGEPDLRTLALVSDGLSRWNEPFQAALIGAEEGAACKPYENGDLLAFPYDDCWLIAGKEGVADHAARCGGAAAVLHERRISYREWPAVFASLHRDLEELLEEWRQSRSFHASIRQAVGYLHDHYMDELTLESMSEQVHVSAAYFSRLFQKETGVTFTAYLTNLRLQQAKHLLSQTEYPVYEVAERIGYRNTRYFMKLFKDTVGCTPTEFRVRAGQKK